uniref:Cadherin domain-containing protein n=1 Tax=Amazona collaria TaxID=241587 RepID=A0A8B9IY78_9PSIT
FSLQFYMPIFLLFLQVLLDFGTGFHVEVIHISLETVYLIKGTLVNKREWIKFAAACREGEDNSKRNPIAKIRSDCEENHPITYSISGVGIDRAPYGIFVVNPRTGEINITSIVDREVTPVFVVSYYFANFTFDLEPPLELRVRVLDINDNPPIFAQTVFTGSIEECSMDNTLVMKIIATDADEPNHLNSKIAFKIESQEPAGPPMFIMNKYTGELHLANYLDREVTFAVPKLNNMMLWCICVGGGKEGRGQKKIKREKGCGVLQKLRKKCIFFYIYNKMSKANSALGNDSNT